MVATWQKNSQGENKILHDQQKNQEILFVSRRKLTFWRKVRKNWSKNPSDLKGLCNGCVDHIINIASYKSMELNISWEISNKRQNPCFTSNKNNVSRIFSNVIDNENILELNFSVPRLPLFASISINDLKKDPYLYSYNYKVFFFFQKQKQGPRPAYL